MNGQSFEIRLCLNPECGLRYPLPDGHPFGERCPLCLGETRIVLTRDLRREAGSRETGGRVGPSVMLDNIRSAWNVGSMLRSADGAGFAHAFLCGVTPTPESLEVRKTALGAEESVSWSSHRDGTRLASRLAAEGFCLLALETVEGAILLDDLDLNGLSASELVLVVGSETTGIDPGILDFARKVISIPMRGRKKSLNAAVAFGIAAFEIGERFEKKQEQGR